MLIEKEKLHGVLKSFYTLTGVRIGVFDKWRNELVAYPSDMCKLCTLLRKEERVDELCIKSDEEAFSMAEKTGKQYIYRCHAGLIESVYPIFSESGLVGFLMIGQFLDGEWKKRLGKVVCEKIESGEIGEEIVESVPILGGEAAAAVAEIMKVCAEYLCFSKALVKKQTAMAEKVEEYIVENADKKISVSDICARFSLSRTTVYMLFKRNFNKSVTEFINDKKIEIACELIENGLSTSLVMERIGVTDANYFCRLFKKKKGIAFREYKRQIAFDGLSKRNKQK
jgi:ligand-binding sensor protein